MECYSTGQNQIGDTDPINKQLFNKTIMQFRAKVIPFYNKVKEAPKVTQQQVVDYIQVCPRINSTYSFCRCNQHLLYYREILLLHIVYRHIILERDLSQKW